jgi:hypothetical protein
MERVNDTARVNDGVSVLIMDVFDSVEPAAARVAAAAVQLGWLSWEQVAAALAGLDGDGADLDGLTADAARERFGSALDGVGDAVLLEVLRRVDAEATEPCCPECGRPVWRFAGPVGWQHVEFVDGAAPAWTRPVTDAGHDVGEEQVWLPGPAAVPVERVGVPPQRSDFDDDGPLGGGRRAGEEQIAQAGQALLAVVHDIDFHHYSDGWSGNPFGDDAEDAAGQIRDLADQLETAAGQARTALAQARARLAAAERVARVRAAHRQRRTAAPAEPGADLGPGGVR